MVGIRSAQSDSRENKNQSTLVNRIIIDLIEFRQRKYVSLECSSTPYIPAINKYSIYIYWDVKCHDMSYLFCAEDYTQMWPLQCLQCLDTEMANEL